MKSILLAGAGITAQIMIQYLKRDPRYKVIGATVDDGFLKAAQIDSVPIVAASLAWQKFSPLECRVIMAMGYADVNRGRESMFFQLKKIGYEIETYVHPDARIYSDYPLGEGSVVLPYAVVEPHAAVGKNSMVWCHATLAHHSTIEDHCWIASGAVISGQTKVRRNTFVGVNATVTNSLTVEEYNIIGGGALITKNTKPSTVHLARSAEVIRFNSQDYAKYYGV